ncbi:MAG: Fis family transcriptional regulator [Nannocystaceae bacterium]|nr:Fis family transcriptional regulator [Nannocystaceae bacterium]
MALACSSSVSEPSGPGVSESKVAERNPARGARSASLSGDAVRALVRAHNKARAAVGVPPIAWSGKVAGTAEAWAQELAFRGCDLQHSTGGPYGENLYWSSAPQSPDAVVGSWTEEAKHYAARNNKCARGKVCGHYTQVVWAESRSVGCAMASCGTAQVWVCNYDPPGNFVGHKPF